MKGIAIALAALLLFASAGALSYDITSHEINVEADKEGMAVVSEKYFVVFGSSGEAGEFASTKNDIGFDLAKWEQFDSRFSINFGSRTWIDDLKVELVEEPSGELLYYLEFRYSFDSPAFNKSETGRKVVYMINRTFLNPLVERNSFIIPAGTTLAFTLPPQSEPEGGLLNNQNVRVEQGQSKTVVIPGSFSSNAFDFGYSFFKPISPGFSIAALVKDFSENTTRESQLVLAFVVGITLLTLYAGRRRIEGKVTRFIIRNSDLSTDESEEDKDFGTKEITAKKGR